MSGAPPAKRKRDGMMEDQSLADIDKMSVSPAACAEFHSRLNAMRRDGEKCDVKIVSRNIDNGDKGCEFMAHMIVLSAASPHFKTMFNSEFKEADVREVNLDMDADVVDQLLEYMYTYDLEINESNASRLLPEAAYLQLDDLKDQCHNMSGAPPAKRKRDGMMEDMSLADIDKMSVSPAACAEFHSRLNAMRRDGEKCDVKIVSRNIDNGDKGCEFMAHMIVLSAASPHFKTMFSSEFKEALVGEVNLDMDADVVDQLLEYMYTYDLEINESNASRLLPEAAYLQLDDLKNQCHKFFISHITPTNCLEMWRFARHYSCDDIQQLAWKTACTKLDDLVDLPSFVDLSKDDLLLLLKDRRLICKESSVFTGAVNWVKADPSRKGDMAELLRLVRLCNLEGNFLLETVGKEPLVIDDQECSRIFYRTVFGLVKKHTPASTSRLGGDWKVAEKWKKGPKLDHDMENCSAVVFNGKIYCINRWNAATLFDGEWSDVAMPRSTGLDWKLCVIADVLYAVGAENNIRSVEKYDATSDSWTIIYSSDSNQGGCLESATVHNGRICVAMRESKTVETFEPNNSASGFSRMCDYLSDVKGALCLVVHDDRLVSIGGYTEDQYSAYTNEMSVYDDDAGQWIDGVALPGPCGYVSTIECDGRLICSGGYDPDTWNYGSDVMMLLDGVWTILPSLKHEREEHAMVVLDNVVYAIGGCRAGLSVERLRIEK